MNCISHFKTAAVFASLICTLPSTALAIRGDYTGDGHADIVVAQSSSLTNKTTFTIRGGVPVILNARADAYTPGDFNGDGITDPAVVQVIPDGTLEWHTSTLGLETTANFGLNGDMPIVGDFDCDGTSDRAVVRNIGGHFFWYFQLSSQATQARQSFGVEGDTLLTADVEGDGCDEMVLVRKRATDILWASRKPSVHVATSVVFGTSADKILPPADLDGDGKADFIVGQSAGGVLTAAIKFTNSETPGSVVLGKPSDVPLVGHFSGAAGAELGFYRKGARARLASTFTLKLPGGNSAIQFGTRASTIIRPDGTAVTDAQTAGEDCGNIVSIGTFRDILYKPSNLHGGRGPTFLVQNKSERTLRQTLKVRDSECRIIGSFGLYATDWPYGSRYYQGSWGGSALSAERLHQLAMRTGNPMILVEGKSKWIRIDDPINRQGNVLPGDQVPR